MDIETYFILQIFIAVASYIQTTTGFGFGLILMSGLIGFNVVGITEGASYAMFLSLCNIVFTLYQNPIPKTALKKMPFLFMMIPGGIVGVYLLYALVNNLLGYRVLYGLLGAFTVFSATNLMQNPAPRPHKSPMFVFYGITFIAGVFGGMFSIAAPPMAYLMYKQPWGMQFIRRVLLTAFGVIIVTRILVIFIYDGIPWADLGVAVLCVPTVYVFNSLTRKHLIHRISTTAVRRLVVVLLFMSGFKILYTAVI